MNKLLFIMLFLYTLSFIFFDREGFIWYFYIVNILLYIVFFLNKYKKRSLANFKINPMIIIYVCFAIFSAFSIIWAIDTTIALGRSITLMLISLNIFIVYNILKEIKTIDPIFIGILFGVFVNFLLAIVPTFSFGENYIGWRFVGTTSNANILAMLALFSILVSIYYLQINPRMKYKVYLALNFVFASYIIFITGSKKGLILGSLLLFVYLFSTVKSIESLVKIVFTIMLLSVVTYVAIIYFIDFNEFIKTFEQVSHRIEAISELFSGQTIHDESTQERLMFISKAFDTLGNHPLLGIGIDNFRVLYGTYAHNNYMELFADVGLVGFFIYYSMYIYILYLCYKMERSYLQFLLSIFIFSMLILDVAQVSYFAKFNVFILITIVYIAESYINTKKRNI